MLLAFAALSLAEEAHLCKEPSSAAFNHMESVFDAGSAQNFDREAERLRLTVLAEKFRVCIDDVARDAAEQIECLMNWNAAKMRLEDLDDYQYVGLNFYYVLRDDDLPPQALARFESVDKAYEIICALTLLLQTDLFVMAQNPLTERIEFTWLFLHERSCQDDLAEFCKDAILLRAAESGAK